MKKAAMAVLLVALAVSLQAQSISDDLTDWVLGTNQPVIVSDQQQPSGTVGPYISLPLGTSAFYYPADSAGTGSVTYWIYDPAVCLNDASADGYPNNGPAWGLRNPLGGWVTVGIQRQSYVAYCQGYSPRCSEAPYSVLWFQGGVRGAGFTAGWYKWTVTGGADDIQFVYNESVSKTYNATSQSSWAGVFGQGWDGFRLIGDGSSGAEVMGLYVESGTGVWDGVGGTTAVSGQYEQSTWSAIKQLYR